MSSDELIAEVEEQVLADVVAGDAAAELPAALAEPADTADAEAAPRQGEMPFAMVQGQAFTELPSDLYIPPDALEVILEAFEGPLDLLLYLIRRQNLDILEINVADITRQYMIYVDMMTAIRFELAAEYLVMAAMLAEIKSRMLLPRPPEAEEEEGEDPRAALIRRLQEYERFKTAAEDIDEIPRIGRDVHQASAQGPDRNSTRPDPDVDLKEVLVALAEVLRRADMFESHQVEREKLSTRERMTQVLDRIRHRQFVPFVSLFSVDEGRLGVVVTFLAVMELVKESLVDLVQNEAFGPIHVRAAGLGDSADEDADSGENGDERWAGDAEPAIDEFAGDAEPAFDGGPQEAPFAEEAFAPEPASGAGEVTPPMFDGSPQQPVPTAEWSGVEGQAPRDATTARDTVPAEEADAAQAAEEIAEDSAAPQA